MTLAAPLLRLALRLRAGRGREIAARLGERRGIDPARRPPGKLIWLHAASVGEVVSLLPVLSAIAARSPDTTTLLTSGTVTSARLLEQRLPQLGLTGRVRHRFVPLDVPAWVARFLDHWRPDAVGFVESELWPNILTACHDRGKQPGDVAVRSRLEDEIGDLLFVCVNLARHAKVDTGTALRRANAKFERRFRAMEQLAKADRVALETLPLEAQDRYWEIVKANELVGDANGFSTS